MVVASVARRDRAVEGHAEVSFLGRRNVGRPSALELADVHVQRPANLRTPEKQGHRIRARCHLGADKLL